MPSIYQLKPAFQNALRPCVRHLFDLGVTANQVTVLAALLSVAVGVLVATMADHAWVFALVPLWMIVRMALNAMDGMLAREFAQQSPLGAYLNELGDIVADCALLLPFMAIAGVNPMLVWAVVLLAVLSEYSGTLGPLVGASRRYDGPMGKSDRAFVFGVLAAGVAMGWHAAMAIDVVLLIVAALSIYTTGNRVRHGLREARNRTD